MLKISLNHDDVVLDVPVTAEVEAALEAFILGELDNSNPPVQKYNTISELVGKHIVGLFSSVIDVHPSPAMEAGKAEKEVAEDQIKVAKAQALGLADP